MRVEHKKDKKPQRTRRNTEVFVRKHSFLRETLSNFSCSTPWLNIIFILLFFSISIFAQETNNFEETTIYEEEIIDLTEEEAEEVIQTVSPERQRMEMEIRTSTLSELALWCRTLGLSESGTREELSKRLRDHFDLPESTRNNIDQKVITIESAQISEYFTIEVVDEDYARLRGDVYISLKDGDTVHTITANEVLFNRTRNILTATGQVFYEKVDSDGTETFRGENITVNLDDWSSIFLDGNSTRKIDDGTVYLFSGSVITHSEQGVTILSDADITNTSNEESLWSISASRIWLLPGSDFAIFNAVLKVGEIPVLYLPFFYFPGEELFFHPVIGYRSREGGFIQTTTYILGQPSAKPEETSSLTKIFSNTDNDEKEIQGLFLRSTGRKVIDPNEISLKALIDYYVNLGTYLGIELSIPKTEILNPIEFSLGLGFTRTVSHVGGVFTPYAPSYDGTFDLNHSNLFSMQVPFRYRMTFNSSISGTIGNLFWNFPFYSDPFVDRDFLNRMESMDLFEMLQQGASQFDDPFAEGEISSSQWHVYGNLNFPVTSVTPYISRASVTNLSTTLSFRTIEDRSIMDDYYYNNNPSRFFFAPDKYTIYNFSGTVLGTPLTIGGARQVRPSTGNEERDDPFAGIGSPISPWQNEETTQSDIVSPDILTPPLLTQSFNIPTYGNTRFSIDYQVSPTSSTELQFLSVNWKTQDDVDWEDVHSILTSISGNSALNFRVDHTSGLFSNTVTFSGNGTWRDFGYLNEDAFLDNNGNVNETRMMETRRQQYSQTNYSTSYAYNGSVRPLMENPIFSQSTLQYNLRGTLVRSKRYAGGDSPELTPQWGIWAKEERINNVDIYGLNNHRITASIAANVMDNIQNLSISADLPPMDGLIETRAIFRYSISETNINFRVERPEDSDWIFKPIHLTEILRFDRNITFTHYMIIKPEENNDITNMTTSLTLWNFTASYSAEKSQKFRFKAFPTGGGEWQPYGNIVLNSKELSFLYNQQSSDIEIIKNRINLSFDVRTSLNFNLQQHTNSNFQLTLGLNLNIPGFLELKMSATAQNSVILRYFKDMPGMEDLTFMYPDGPQNNVLIDLLDSFNFLDDTMRRRSGFKMQRLNFTATHFLGDWTAELGVSMYPFRNTALADRTFSIVADISFIIKWIPISEIYSDISLDGKNDRWITR